MQSIYGSHPSSSSSSRLRDDGRIHCDALDVGGFSAIWEALPTFGQNISRFHLFKEMIAPFLGQAELALMGEALRSGGERCPMAPDEHRRSEWFRCLASIFESRMQLPREADREGPNVHPALRYACLVLPPKARPGAERTMRESNVALVWRTQRLVHLYLCCPLLRQPTYRSDEFFVHERVWGGLDLPDRTIWQTLLRYRLEYAESIEPAGSHASTQPRMNLRDEIESLLLTEPYPTCLPISHLAESLLTMATQLCPMVPRRPAEEMSASSIPGPMLLGYLRQDIIASNRQRRILGDAIELGRPLLRCPDSLLACVGQHDLGLPGEGQRQVLQALFLRDWFREELSQVGKDYLKIRLDTLSLVVVPAGAPHLATRQMGLPALEIELLTALLGGTLPVTGQIDLLKAWFTKSEQWHTILRGAWAPMWDTIRQHAQDHPHSEEDLKMVLTGEVLEALLHDVASRVLSESSPLRKILAVTLPDPMGGAHPSPQYQALMLQTPPLARTLIEHPDHWDHFMDCFQSWNLITLMSSGPGLLDMCIEDPRAWKFLEECSRSFFTPGRHRGLNALTLMITILAAPGLMPMVLNGQMERPPFAELVPSLLGDGSARTSLAAPGILDRIAMMPLKRVDRLLHSSPGNNVDTARAIQAGKYQEDVWQELVDMPLFQVHLLHCPGMIEHWATKSSLWTWIRTIDRGDWEITLALFACPHVQAHLNHPDQRDVWYQHLSSVRGAQLQLVQDPLLFAKLVARPDLWQTLREMRHAPLSDLVRVLEQDPY